MGNVTNGKSVQNGANSNKAFNKSVYSNRTCFKCKKVGHVQSECNLEVRVQIKVPIGWVGVVTHVSAVLVILEIL